MRLREFIDSSSIKGPISHVSMFLFECILCFPADSSDYPAKTTLHMSPCFSLFNPFLHDRIYRTTLNCRGVVSLEERIMERP
jgi:hypothetical protein